MIYETQCDYNYGQLLILLIQIKNLHTNYSQTNLAPGKTSSLWIWIKVLSGRKGNINTDSHFTQSSCTYNKTFNWLLWVIKSLDHQSIFNSYIARTRDLIPIPWKSNVIWKSFDYFRSFWDWNLHFRRKW